MLYPHPIAIPMKTLADAIAASAVSAATNHPIGIIKTASGFSAVIDVSDDRTRNLAALAIEQGATMASSDSDFRRLSGFRLVNPLE